MANPTVQAIVRLTPANNEKLDKLKQETGLSKNEIMNIAIEQLELQEA